MLPKFLQNQSNNFLRGVILSLLSLTSFSQDYRSILKTLIEIDQKETKNFQYIDLTHKDNYTLNTQKYDYRINKSYLTSVLFHVPFSLGKIAYENQCRFLELVHYKMIDHPHSEEIILDQRLKGQFEYKTIKANIDSFFKKAYSGICPKIAKKYSFKRSEITNLLNIETLKSKKSKFHCENDFDKFSKRADVIKYLVFAQRIKSKKIYLKELKNNFSLKKLLSFYGHLFQEKPLCGYYENIPNQELSLANSSVKSDFIIPICKSTYQNKKKIKNCLTNFQDLKKTCSQFNFNKGFGFIPSQQCRSYIKQLAQTSSLTPIDNPSSLKGDTTFQAMRIFNFFSKSKSYEDFLKFLENEEHPDFLNSRICYKNKFINERKCEKVFFSDSKNYYSISSQLEKILIHQKIIPNSLKCKFGNNRKKNKVGCYIEIKSKHCAVNNCQVQIFLNNKPLKFDIEIQTDLKFNYWQGDRYQSLNSFLQLIARKYNLLSKLLQSSTELNKYLEKEDALIHGIACLEDILPYRVKRNNFSQCSPSTFLIKDYNQVSGEYILQLPQEANNFVRSLTWKELSQSITNFSNQINLNWTLYAIFKDS